MATARSKYSLLNRINFEDLYNAFLGMESRQQVFLVGGGVIIFLFLLFVPVTCATSKLGELETDYEKSFKSEQELLQKVSAYQTSKARLEAVRQRLGGSSPVSLTSQVESLANEVGIGQNIDRLKPISFPGSDYFDEEGVDVFINKVNLGQLTDFLFRLENSPGTPARIRKVSIKPRFGSREDLTVNLQISVLKAKGETGE